MTGSAGVRQGVELFSTAFGGWVKVHIKGHADLPYYARIQDIDVDKNAIPNREH